jgi:Mrp family chromosome partitioning ATPase
LLIRDLLNSFDHVLIDTPAASLGADARIIANHCGAAMVVGSKGQSQLPPLQKLVKQLTSSQVKIAGVLVNEHRN